MSTAELRARLPELMLRDAHRLERRLAGARKTKDEAKRAELVAAVAADVDAAELRLARRREAVPAIEYPAELPISARVDDLRAAIESSQVVVVAGETGSGKTTQLPKVCLQLGRGVRGMIGHTQPRRLAARTVADRIADEVGTPLGDTVGFAVRFTDQVGDRTLVKLMTDGILLAEIQHDPMLRRYDTLIIDEAHERSLNIDFLLGYLRRLLPRRPDLKLIITSATIDPERFAEHFAAPDGTPAPIVEVSGRTYPVEVRYRPIADDDRDRDQTQAILDAVTELDREAPGDILVFLSGEREIRDTADALGKLDLPNTEVLPLYARLSTAEQHRVFAPHSARRIVLATNVAETSLTVPGIKYVIDPGTARISRYSRRTKVQRLPIEPISQASANQRAGRCGRLSDGICIRLYAEDDYTGRPAFTEPEIVRTNLASVILQMTALGLGDMAAFPFVDPPDRRSVADGVALLHELGALNPLEEDPAERLTPIGRQLARLPVDPRLGRMVLEADRNGAVHEVLVLAAALSIQDPRERPADAQQAATESHSRFLTKGAEYQSDFTAYLNLWEYLTERQRELSSSQFRKLCRTEFLHYLRVREWQDLVGQLRQVAKTIGVRPQETPADPKAVHRSLLAGLLSHVGMRDGENAAAQQGGRAGRGGEYLGARGARFAVSPGSALFRRSPRWVMAAELVETSRLWGRVVARIEPEWVEELAGHLVLRVYNEPRWDRRRGGVVAQEKVTLYGLPVVPSRKVDYGRIDPELSRELFIRHALVEGDWDGRHAFLRANRELLEDVSELENRARRRDIVVDDEALFDFYDQRVGREVTSARHFDSWWKKTRRERPDLLTFTASMLVDASAAAAVSEHRYPDELPQGGLTLPLSYHFEPGAATDGVTVHIPLSQLNQVTGEGVDWQVPGLREELVTALIRSLPKPLRRSVVPAPDYARRALAGVGPADGPLLDVLERRLRELAGVVIDRADWDLSKVPAHLRMTYRVADDAARTRPDRPAPVLAEGKDLAALKRELAPRTQAAVSAAMASAGADLARDGLTGWDLGELPRVVERVAGGHRLRGYPSLVDAGESVSVRLLDTEAEQRRAMWSGTRRLLALTGPPVRRYVAGRLSRSDKLVLSVNPDGSVPALLDDCSTAVLDAIIAEHGGPAWDAAGFAALADATRAGLEPRTLTAVTTAAKVVGAARDVERRLNEPAGLGLLPSVQDAKAQLAELVPAGFATAAGERRLPDLVRYLTALDHRLARLRDDPARDRERTAVIGRVRAEYAALLDRLPPERRDDDAVRQLRWMIEELRVSLFAQSLRTAYPISEQRFYRALDALG